MTVDEAVNLAGILKGLVRGMDEDQRRTAAKALLQFNVGPAQAAIDDYVKRAATFVLADFIKLLTGKPMPTAAVCSTAEMLHRDRDVQRRIMVEHQQLDHIVGQLSADELDRLRGEVLAELALVFPEQAEMLAKLPVAKSVTIRHLIARRVSVRNAMEGKSDEHQ